MIKDILNLLKFNPEPIECYQKYSIIVTVAIAVFISVIYALFLPHPPEISFVANFLLTLMMMPIILALGLFLQSFLKLKHKKTSFHAIFTLLILSSIIDVLIIPLVFLTQLHEVFNYLQLVVFCYSFLIFLFAFAKANEVGLGFSLLAMLFGTIVSVILMIVVNIIFITLGLIPISAMLPV
jgi:hypothetical protein